MEFTGLRKLMKLIGLRKLRSPSRLKAENELTMSTVREHAIHVFVY